MTNKPRSFTPESLAQHFEAPDNFTGCFGWICGYSADSGFLADAVERFTRRTEAQRAYEGRLFVALMLDPSHRQISPVEVPGVFHLPIDQRPGSDPKPFKLLHAKLALLGFRHESDASQWQLRLIVSTGNWTRETLQSSLDLVWRVDLCSGELTQPDDSTCQSCADVNTAWELLSWLRGYFDLRTLDARPYERSESLNTDAIQLVEDWIRKARRKRKGASPQFFHNRKTSLLNSLPTLVDTHCGRVIRNYLAMGSGFYETPNDTSEVPLVLQRIVNELMNKELLTQRPKVDVFVNPGACQAVAGAFMAIQEEG